MAELSEGPVARRGLVVLAEEEAPDGSVDEVADGHVRLLDAEELPNSKAAGAVRVDMVVDIMRERARQLEHHRFRRREACEELNADVVSGQRPVGCEVRLSSHQDIGAENLDPVVNDSTAQPRLVNADGATGRYEQSAKLI